MVSPVIDERECKKIKRYSHFRLAHQPVDLREGMAKAYSVVKEVCSYPAFYPSLSDPGELYLFQGLNVL